MQLLFKQRFFTWFDSYDIYDEAENVVYAVEGQLAWGHKLHILDRNGEHIGTVREVPLTFLPRFELYSGDAYVGCIRKEFSLFHPVFTVDCNDWQIEGDFMGWDYTLVDRDGNKVASVSKELFHMTDTYVLNVERDEDALMVLMVVLAIDAEKCSNG